MVLLVGVIFALISHYATATIYICSCQCPYGSNQGFVYAIQDSAEACVRACIIRSPYCKTWNTYACSKTNCVYSDSYIYSRWMKITPRYKCSCPCTDGSNRPTAYADKNSPEACAVACNSTTEINRMEENVTIDSIIDRFKYGFYENSFSSRINDTFFINQSIAINETKLGLVDPRDVSILASYRRAIFWEMYRDEDRFEQVQIRVRQHLLETLGCNIEDIEKNLQWEWISRDKCGFRLAGQPLKVPKPANGKIYSTVEGISFYANGSFSLNLIEANEKNALFNSDDVDLVMKQGITRALFSLDPPTDLPHPFKKGSWLPYDALDGTDFLATMLHADLLLKNMNSQAESSAKSPFRTRSIRDGAYLGLSEDLYQQLFNQSRAKYEGNISAIRIWIESGPMKYNIIEYAGSTIYKFGPSNMQFKYENFKRVRNNVTGEIHTIVADTSPWFEHFSRIATANYNELGNSFPELLRLAELAKLIATTSIFQHYYRELHRVIHPPTIETIGNILNLSNLRGQVFDGNWPLVTDARIEQILDESLVKQGISLSRKHLARNLAEVRAHIRQQLTTAQNNQIMAVARFLSRTFNISIARISRAAISSYLANSHSNAEKPLLNEIVSGIAQRMKNSQQDATRLYETMSQSGYSVGDLSSNLSAFAQTSPGKGPLNNSEVMRSSPCYNVPKQILFTYHGDGSVLPQMGGIKLRPYLEYEQAPIVNLNPLSVDTGLRNFNQRMNQVFPPQNGIQPRITGEYGEERKSGSHRGIDFNYIVPGQRDINLEHPTVNSPVDGKIVFVSGNYGAIKIRTSDGYSHEILHLHSTSVHVGDFVKVGQAIGTMGGRGSKLTTEFAQHVHYQVKDSEGKIVNPREYFENENRKQTGWTKP